MAYKGKVLKTKIGGRGGFIQRDSGAELPFLGDLVVNPGMAVEFIMQGDHAKITKAFPKEERENAQYRAGKKG